MPKEPPGHGDDKTLRGGSMKKKFVAPMIREEATLSQLTLGVLAISGASDGLNT